MIVDSPPLQAVTDAAILASIADGTILVVDSRPHPPRRASHRPRGTGQGGGPGLGRGAQPDVGPVRKGELYYEYYGAKDEGRRPRDHRGRHRHVARVEAGQRRNGRPGQRPGRAPPLTGHARDLPPMRVLLFGINYRPEPSGIGPYTAGLAQHLAGRGDEVTVITGLPSYPGWRLKRGTPRRLLSTERIDGVTVIRAAHFIPGTQTAAKRAMYEGTFGLTGLIASLRISRPDAILGVVPSLSGGILARLAGRRFGTPYGLLFQDLMGPAARQSGIAGGGMVGRVTSSTEGWVAAGARAVAVVTDGFTPYLVSLGVRNDRIHHVPNWVRIAPPCLDRASVHRQFGWPDDRQIVLHAGNMGSKQGLDQVVDAARLAADRGEPGPVRARGGRKPGKPAPGGGGARPHAGFLPVQPDGVYAGLVAAADVLLLSERAMQECMSLPSKLTSYFAAGRPIVAAVPEDGPSAREMERSRAGISVPAGQARGHARCAGLAPRRARSRAAMGRPGLSRRRQPRPRRPAWPAPRSSIDEIAS